MISSEKNISLDSLLKFLSITYIFLLAAGFVYAHFLYKPFGIIISEYIDLNDILLLFLPLLTDSFVLILLMVGGSYLMYKLIFIQHDDSKRKEFTLELRKMHRNFLFIWLAAIIVLIILVIVRVKVIRGLAGLSLIGMMIFAPYLLERLFIFLNKEFKLSITSIYKELLYIFIIFLALIIWVSSVSVDRINRKSGFRHFEIIYKNTEVVKSDSNTYYIGRTRNYLFIYDFRIKKSRILNVDEIKEIILSKK